MKQLPLTLRSELGHLKQVDRSGLLNSYYARKYRRRGLIFLGPPRPGVNTNQCWHLTTKGQQRIDELTANQS